MRSNTITIVLFLLACLHFRAETFCQEAEVRSSILRVIDKLRSEDRMHIGNPVGYAGIPETGNQYYKLYLRLKSNASNSELLQLVKDSSDIIKLYSFMILADRGDSSVRGIFLENIENASCVWIASGCTGVVNQVNHFMLSCLRPDLPASPKVFTMQEFRAYAKAIDMKL